MRQLLHDSTRWLGDCGGEDGRSHWQDGSFLPQWPEISAACRDPDIIAGEADMLSTEWANVLDNIGRRGDALSVELGESRLEIERVSVDD